MKKSKKKKNPPPTHGDQLLSDDLKAAIKPGGRFSQEKSVNLGGRPLKPITAEQVKALALAHCTAEECAATLGTCVSVIYDRFSEALRSGHEEGQMSLKRKMHEKALAGVGDTSMLIWLSKQRCGYKERREEEAQQTTIHVHVNEVPT